MSWTHERARVASLSRSRTPDDPELIDARQKLRVERAADYIRKTVDAAPALLQRSVTGSPCCSEAAMGHDDTRMPPCGGGSRDPGQGV